MIFPSRRVIALLLMFAPLYYLQSQIHLQKETYSGNQYKLQYVSSGYYYDIQELANKKYISFNGPILKEEEIPFPTRELYIAIPPDSHPAIQFVVTKQQPISLEKFENIPNNNIPRYKIKGCLWVGNYYCMHITVNPFSYDASSGRIIEIREFLVNINLPAVSAANSEKTHEKLPEMVDNVQFAEQWKAQKAMYSIPQTDSWIDYSQEYLKIGVANDGIYRLTYLDLQANGIPVSTLNPNLFKLFLKGKEIPLYVHSENDNTFKDGDYIEFLGRRNYGSSHYREPAAYGTPYNEYLNRYSDTTIYWLSWNGNIGKRVDTVAATSGYPSDTTRYYDELIHSEKDVYWDFSLSGDNLRKNIPDILENKTWNEGTLGVGTKQVLFSVSNLFHNEPSRAFVKLQDYSSNITTNAHDLALSINSFPSMYDSGYINKYQVKVLTANFSSALLSNGDNIVNINSFPTLNTINNVARDWYELEYPRYLISDTISLNFSYRYPIVPKVSLINITGVSYSPVSLYRFSNLDSSIIKITNYIHSNDTLQIIDTVAAGSSYFLIRADRAETPFIIYKKKFVNLRNTSNQADYIAITHPYFLPDAANYISFISSTYNVATKLVNVYDIYDEFNYGFFAAEPIRDFLKSTFIYWQSPKPKFVFLIGKTTYDYYSDKTKYFGVPALNNFVPSYGNPVSDTWLTIWDSTGSMIPQMNIGRVPVKSIDEFQYYFSKHQKYATKGYDDWNKRYIFFAGGDFTDSNQIAQCKSVNDFIINNYVEQPPIGGESFNFYKTANPITNFGPYNPEYISDAIAQGSIFISYIGHSGTQTWDNSITDVSQLANIRDRNPLITDFGCSTGKFAEPDVFAFCELSVNDLKGQAIAYIGNSSLGFTSTAYTFPQVFYKEMLLDTSLSIGETHRLAKLDYIKEFGTSNEYGIFIQTNSLIGDPIITLPIPKKPNFSLSNTTITTNPQVLTEQTDSVSIIFAYNNYGKVVNDSVEILIKDQYNGALSYSKMIKRHIPFFVDSLSIAVPIKGKPGEHLLSINIDPSNLIDEIYKNDNSLSYQFIVASSNIRNLAITQLENQTQGNIQFLNPSIQPSQNTFAVEVSSNNLFSPSKSYTVPYDTFYSKYKIDTSLIGKRIWLRTKFDASSLEGLTYSYFIGKENNYFLNDSVSFLSLKTNQTNIYNNQIMIDTTKVIMSAISGGVNDGNTAVISENGQNFIPQNTVRGFHVCVFDGAMYNFIGYYRFDVQSSLTVSTNFINFLDTLSAGYIVIAAIANDVASNSSDFPEALKTAIKQYGSIYIDSVGVADSWAMIGWKNASPGRIPEKYAKRYNGHTISIDTTIIIPNANGTFETENIGPVATWKNAEIRYSNPASGTVKFTVVGIKPNNTVDTIPKITLADSTIDLSKIDAQQYPFIRISGALGRGLGRISPSIYSVAVNYNQFAELGTNYQAVESYVTENGNVKREINANDTILQGEKLIIKYRVYNVGGVTAKTFGVRVNSIWENNNNELVSSKIIDSLMPQTYKLDSVVYNTSLGYGKRSIQITIDPDTLIKEIFKDNNFYSYPIYVRQDSALPFYPNLFITQNNINPLVSPITMAQDSVRFMIVYGNSGAWINDSVTIAIKQFYMNANVASWNIRRKFPIDYDTLYIRVPILKRAGEHQLQVTLDPFGLITESSKLDNTASYYFTVVTTDFIILQPTSISSSWFSKLIFMNPTNLQNSANMTANLEIDTMANYSTAKKIRIPMSEYSTSYDISTLQKLKRYYWRIRQQQSDTNWTCGSFFLGSSSAFSIGQSDSIGWKNNIFSHAEYLPAGVHIADTKNSIIAISAGYNDGRTGSIQVNGTNVISPIFGEGHNLVVLDSGNYSIISRKRFDVSNNADESDSLTQFLSSIPKGLLVVNVIVDDGSNNLKQSTRDAFKSIGSAYIDKLSWRDSWAIIGRKGAAVGSVSESYMPQTTGQAIADTTFIKKEYFGTISTQMFGPISKISAFSLAGSVPGGAKIQAQFVGTRYNSAIDTLLLYSNYSLPSPKNQDAVGYQQGKLIFTLQTANQISPVIKNWNLSAMPPTELLTSNNSCSISRPEIMEGESVTFNANIYNISSVPADSVTVQLSTNESGFDNILQSQRYNVIPANDSVFFSYVFSSKGKRGNQTFILKIDPMDSIIEQTKDNNVAAESFFIQSDTVRPSLQITFDGSQINSGAYIKKQPQINIFYSDNNPSVVTLADTTNFDIYLNSKRVYFIPGTAEFLPATSPGTAKINWTPTLPNGENNIQIYANDIAGNSSDTIVLVVNVSDIFTLNDIFNFPDPFVKSTDFTFNIMDPTNPDEVTIKIYTIAGRLIQEIKSSCKIGFNKIFWDGRDKDGDEIANGVYFYKIIVKSNGMTKEAIQKLAKVR